MSITNHAERHVDLTQFPLPQPLLSSSSDEVDFLLEPTHPLFESQTDKSGLHLSTSGIVEQKVFLLDPHQLRPGFIPNRHAASFEDKEFEKLRKSIQLAGGNVQPILVRPVPLDDSGVAYEIIYGERRHRACLLAGVKVRAIVETAEDATHNFLKTFRENQGRANLSPWELGCQIRFGLDLGYFSSLRRAAAEVGRDISDISKALQLASLPAEVIEAFASPLDLQYRHAKPLSDAVSAAREAVLAEARRILEAGESTQPGKVLAMLVAAAQIGVGPSNTQKVEVGIEVHGQHIGHLVADQEGRVQVNLELVLDERQREELIVQMQRFYKRCIVKSSRRVSSNSVAL